MPTGGEPRTVLLVDDAEDYRLLIRRVLDESGHFRVIGEAASGPAAIDLAQQLQPQVVLLDESMPGMNGLDALPAIREQAPGADVVLWTGYESFQLERQARERGAIGVVEKDVRASRVVEQLLQVLGSGDTDA